MTIAALGAQEPASMGDAGLVVWIEGEDRARPMLEREVQSIADLFARMARRGIDSLAIHAAALPAMGLPARVEVPKPGESRPRHPWLDCTFLDKRPSHGALSPAITSGDGKREVLIGAYQDGAGDPFGQALDARELRDALVLFRDAFAGEKRRKGWAWRQNAIYTGWSLMHAPWKSPRRAGGLPALDDTRLPELAGVQGAGWQLEVPYGSWAPDRALVDARAARPWAHAWDVNGQRLAACARIPLGIGGLEHRPAGGEFDARLPGYHLVTSVDHPHEGLIPPIFTPGWHTTPRVQMARQLALNPVVAESWVWTEYAQYLNPWYEQLRDARQTLLQLRRVDDSPHWKRCAVLALDALKQCYLQPLGRLRSTRARESNSPYYRPAWYDTVIGQELAREYLRLHELAEQDIPVLAVYFDTIICETNDIWEIPGPITVSDQLGKYKHLGVTARALAYDALYIHPQDKGDQLGRGPNVAALVKLLKAADTPDEAPTATGSPSERQHTHGPVPAPAGSAALSSFTRPVHGGYPG